MKIHDLLVALTITLIIYPSLVFSCLYALTVMDRYGFRFRQITLFMASLYFTRALIVITLASWYLTFLSYNLGLYSLGWFWVDDLNSINAVPTEELPNEIEDKSSSSLFSSENIDKILGDTPVEKSITIAIWGLFITFSIICISTSHSRSPLF